MKLTELKREIEIPKGVQVSLEERTVMVKGPQGENQRTFIYPRMALSMQENKIIMSVKNANKKDKTMLGTFQSHATNLVNGVNEGFTYKVKVCSGHFPMTIASETNLIIINNFMGEKVPRKAKIFDGVKVEIQGDIITLTGPDKEKVGQSAANIELATRRSGFDKRVFQDGCYIIEKSGKDLSQ